jgi:DNA-binding response OmpR family regulator
MDKGTILVVEDEPNIADLVDLYLSRDGFRVVKKATGEDGLAAIRDQQPRLVVLDVGLPDVDGLEVCRRIRATSALPVIFLTARADEVDRILGLELGADDYLTKPFSPRELLARIRALLRRSRQQQTVAEGLQRIRAYHFAGWELNVRLRRLISPKGEAVLLTNAEFNLLAAFLAAPQRVLSRDQLISLSRLHNDEVFDRSIDSQIARLRKKIDPRGEIAQLIRTERRAGYIFTAHVEIVR